jgi:hypothetical protein
MTPLLDGYLTFAIPLSKLTILFTSPCTENYVGGADDIQDTDKASPQEAIQV